MDFKSVLIIVVIIAIIGGGILWWSMEKGKLPAEEIEGEILSLLEGLKKDTGINFPEILPVEIEWNVKKEQEIEEMIIRGGGFDVVGLSIEQEEKIKEFITNKEFKEDIYNIADGTVSGLIGYKKDQTVCVVVSGATGYKDAEGQWIPPDPEKRDVDVKCGKATVSIEHIITKEEVIKKLFAEKYNKKMAEVTLSIDQETEDHVRGGVEFLPGGLGEGGLFLAAKVDDLWELAFDGTGAIYCKEIEEYNFPEDMIEDCSEIQTQPAKTENGEVVEVKSGEDFAITLKANPTTGYQWEADFDSNFIQLIDREYIPSSPGLVGSGGQEIFDFLILKTGKTDITFSYQREWEEGVPSIEKKVYKIIIK